MHINSSDRRKFTRFNFDRQANIEFVSAAFSDCRTKDISLTGLFAFGAFQQRLEEYCFFNLIQSSRAKGPGLAAAAKVVRENDEGLAIMFTSMPFASYMLLRLTLLGEAAYPFNEEKFLPSSCPFQVTGHW